MPIVQKQLADVLTVARASAGTVFDAAGNLVTVADNLPRFDYDPVTKAFKGLLVEEQRTNLFSYSADISAAAWGKSNLSAGADGSLARSTTAAATASRTLSYPIGTQLTFTVYAKKRAVGGRFGMRILSSYPHRADAVFDLSSGTVVGTVPNWYTNVVADISGPSIDGFYRCRLTATVGGSDTTAVQFGPSDVSQPIGAWEGANIGLSDCFVKNLQLELGAFPTSYIPTTTAAATRAADVVQVIDGLWRGNSAHTLYVEASRPQLSYGVFATLKSGNTLLFLESGFADPSILRASLTVNGAGGPIALSYGAVAGQAYKMAVTAAPGRVAYARDGVVVGSAAAAQVPGVPSLVIGSVGASGFLNGHIRNVQYTDRVLSDADLIAVSQKGLAA